MLQGVKEEHGGREVKKEYLHLITQRVWIFHDLHETDTSFSFTEVSEKDNFITQRNKTVLHQSKEGKESGHLSCVCFTVFPG